MDLASDRLRQLKAAWRALKVASSKPGWHTIPIEQAGSVRVSAGRQSPGNEEAVVFDFPAVAMSRTLPQGKGFHVLVVPRSAGGQGIALCRIEAASLELFELMSLDILNTLSTSSMEELALFGVFIDRVRCWQEFMSKGDSRVLSSEAEVGLFGELLVLETLIGSDLPASAVIEAWDGPLGGLRDFCLGMGAIEVKSTISTAGFRARVGSLEQLDDSLIRPIYVACVRMRLASGGQGRTLPELVRCCRDLLIDKASSLIPFNDRLIGAGFLDSSSEEYRRRFSVVAVDLVKVDERFPRIVSNMLSPSVLSARYEVNVDLAAATVVPLDGVLRQLGVL